MLFDFHRLMKSFRYAWQGLVYIFETEQNFRLELIGSVAITLLMFYYNISWIKIILVGFLLLFILSLEIINTIFEEVTDFLHDTRCLAASGQLKECEIKHNEIIKHVKDLAAAVVLLAGFFSAVLAIAIFLKV